MYPLLLKPATKSYLWGGEKLKSEYNIEGEFPLAEAWVMSAHKNGESTVLNGNEKDKALSVVLKKWGIAEDLPLIKLIDAKQKLSLQVHPDEAYAAAHENSHGKTEMWYIIAARRGAEIIYGLNKTLNKDELAAAIENGSITDYCNHLPVKAGDAFLINAGTLHAIGDGILVAEVQQSSDLTYRVSDYGRRDKFGNLRELHIEKAIAVTTLQKSEIPVQTVPQKTDYGSIRKLSETPYFKVDLINLQGEKTVFSKKSFTAITLLNGSLTATFDSETLTAVKGQSLFIPSGIKVTLNGTAEFLQTVN